MAVNPVNATQAYQAALQNMKGGGMVAPDAPDETGQSGFSAMVKNVAGNAIEANRRAEQLSADVIAGRAEVTDVVSAISEAEVTLQTIVTVRDRVISAYQEILRMPI